MNPYRPNSTSPGYSVLGYSNKRSNYDYSQTCITALGDTCNPNFYDRDWVKETISILNRDWAARGILESARQQEWERSCPANYPYNKEDNQNSEISRRKRCEFRYDFPPRNDSPFKICAYDCKGYGGLATFPWPKDLPCPESFDDLFPNIPPGYPDPNDPN